MSLTIPLGKGLPEISRCCISQISLRQIFFCIQLLCVRDMKLDISSYISSMTYERANSNASSTLVSSCISLVISPSFSSQASQKQSLNVDAYRIVTSSPFVILQVRFAVRWFSTIALLGTSESGWVINDTGESHEWLRSEIGPKQTYFFSPDSMIELCEERRSGGQLSKIIWGIHSDHLNKCWRSVEVSSTFDIIVNPLTGRSSMLKGRLLDRARVWVRYCSIKVRNVPFPVLVHDDVCPKKTLWPISRIDTMIDLTIFRFMKQHILSSERNKFGKWTLHSSTLLVANTRLNSGLSRILFL